MFQGYFVASNCWVAEARKVQETALTDATLNKRLRLVSFLESR